MRSANQGINAVSRIIPILAAVFLVASVGATPAVQGEAIKLDAPAFEWLDVIEDGATFEWSVDVVNNTNEAIRVRVFLDLRDDDDRSINRDDQGNPNDLVIITIEPGATVPVKQQGMLPYDHAAEVVAYSHRYEIIQGED